MYVYINNFCAIYTYYIRIQGISRKMVKTLRKILKKGTSKKKIDW